MIFCSCVHVLLHCDLLCCTFSSLSICCLMLQLIINLLPVNHEPFFPLSYYVVTEFLESTSVGEEVIRGTCICGEVLVFVLIRLFDAC